MAQLIAEAEVDALPLPANTFLANYIRYASACTDAHKAYHVVCGLGALAQTVNVDYSFPFGSPMFSHVYGLCIGKSTESRKSAGIGIATKLVEDAVPGALGEVPGSKENLIDALRMQPRQLIAYGEFGSFLASAERGYMMPLKTTYTEAWDGASIGRGLVRKSKEQTEAKNPRLSLLCGSTLDFLERHTEPADWTGGFMSRFLVMYPDRERTWARPPGAQPGTREALVKQLAEYNASSTFEIGVTKWGPCQGFTRDADIMWTEWYHALGRRASESNANEVAGGIARTHAHALKVAMLLAWDAGIPRHGQPWYLPDWILRPALMIADLHIRSLLRVGENLAASKDMRDRQTVFAAIEAVPKLLGPIIRKSKLLKRRTVEIIETLIEEGVVVTDNTLGLSGVGYRRATAEEIAEKGNPQVTQPAPVFNALQGGAQVLQLADYRVSSNTSTGGAPPAAPMLLSFESPAAAAGAPMLLSFSSDSSGVSGKDPS